MAFETCEPRWPLTAVLELPIVADAVAGGEDLAAEPVAEVCLRRFDAPDCDAASSGQLESGDQEPIPADRPAEITAHERGDAPPSEWNGLDAGSEPIWLSATLEESGGEPGEATGDPSHPFRMAQDRAEDAIQSDAQRGVALPPWTDAPSLAAGFAAERREWTAAGVVRYSLPDLPPPSSPGATSRTSPPSPASAGYLDVGRLLPSGTARRWQPPAPLERLELASADAASSALVHDLAIVQWSAASPGPQKPSPDATSVRPSLSGESRGQRMLLLAASSARLRKPAFVPPLVVPAGQPASPDAQARDDTPSLPVADPGSSAGPTNAAPTALGGLPWPSQPPAPAAETRISRSAMEGVTVFVLLAARLFRRSPRREPLPGDAFRATHVAGLARVRKSECSRLPLPQEEPSTVR